MHERDDLFWLMVGLGIGWLIVGAIWLYDTVSAVMDVDRREWIDWARRLWEKSDA